MMQDFIFGFRNCKMHKNVNSLSLDSNERLVVEAVLSSNSSFHEISYLGKDTSGKMYFTNKIF